MHQGYQFTDVLILLRFRQHKYDTTVMSRLSFHFAFSLGLRILRGVLFPVPSSLAKLAMLVLVQITKFWYWFHRHLKQDFKKENLLGNLIICSKIMLATTWQDCFRTKALKPVTGLKNKIAWVVEENCIKMQISSC